MLKKTKTKIAAAILAVAAALGAGGYFGKQYFDENYVLLNLEDQAQIDFAFKMAQLQAYHVGKAECKKDI